MPGQSAFSGALHVLAGQDPRGRMLRGIGANIYDKTAVLIVQLLAIPLLTKAWGAEGYGLWLMLLTIPTYIALGDLGLGTASGAEITRQLAGGDRTGALVSFHSTVAFVGAVVGIAALAGVGVAGYLYSRGSATIGPFSRPEFVAALLCILAYGVLVSLMSLITVLYRATHRFAFAMTFAGSLILLEGAALVAAIWAGWGISGVAALYLALRAIGCVAFGGLLQRREPWVQIGFARASFARIRALAKPSAAALALTLSGAVLVQGLILTLGFAAGAAAVAVFGASRTITRVPLQLAGLVLRPSLPELTRALALGDAGLVGKLSRANLAAALAATVPFGLLVTVFGQDLLGFLTQGLIHSTDLIFALLALAATAHAIWMAAAAPLIAANRQAEFAFAYPALSCLVVAAPLLPGVTLTGAAIALSGAEAMMLLLVLHKVRHGATFARVPP